MHTLIDYLRGLRASVAPPSLVALGWAYAATLVAAAILGTVAFAFVSSTVAGSAMAEQLRRGVSGSWLVDLTGQPGAQTTVGMLVTLGLALAPVYLALVVFLSGGVVSAVLRSLGAISAREPRTFFAACARHLGPMARVALVEAVVLGIAVTGMLIVASAGAALGLGHWFSWGWLAISVAALALVTAVFDFARVDVVARDHRSAIRACREAARFSGRRAPSVVAVVAINLALALAVAAALMGLHSAVDLSTAAGVFLGLLAGQLAVVGRLWARIAAYATEAAVWQRTEIGRGEPVRVDSRPFAVAEEPAHAPESQPL